MKNERDAGRLSDKEVAFLCGTGMTLMVGSVWYMAGGAKALLLLGGLLLIAGLVSA